MNKEYFISPMLRRGPRTSSRLPRILREFVIAEERESHKKIVTDALSEEGINLSPEKIEELAEDTQLYQNPSPDEI